MAYVKARISMDIRRQVAARYGCTPGNSVVARCYKCDALGTVWWVMGYTGRGKGQIVFQGFEIDHVFPESLGGKTVAGNLALLCRTCNRRKGARSEGDADGW